MHLALALLAPTASAQTQAFSEGPPYSIDIEFLRPSFGNGAFWGVDSPTTNRNLTVRVGTLQQYQEAPLTLYEAVQNQELGPVVPSRWAAHYGVSLDVQRVSFSLVVPTALNLTSSQAITEFEAPGFGLGDIGIGGKLVALRTPRDLFNIGLRAGISFPSGQRLAYMGEETLRGTGGVIAGLHVGQLWLTSDLGVMLRDAKLTSEDFVASNEATWGNGIRYKLPDGTRVGLQAQMVTRAVFDEFLKGGAENAIEAMGGVEVYPSRRATVSLGAGRGLTEGYGTTDLRVVGSLVIEVPPKEPVIRVVGGDPPPPPPPPGIPDPEPVLEDPEPEAPVFEEGEVVAVFRDQIYIKDMIEFVVDTNTLLDKSIPTLQAVANVINASPDAWRYGHIIIEGHASIEGTTSHNYELAESRARRIWEKLMEFGVARERISYRGMGEVDPIVEAKNEQDEEALQKNRRVEFHIVQQFDDPTEIPEHHIVQAADGSIKAERGYPTSQILPWNEEIVKVVTPEPPPPPAAPEPKGPKLDEFGLPIDEDEEEAPKPAPKPDPVPDVVRPAPAPEAPAPAPVPAPGGGN